MKQKKLDKNNENNKSDESKPFIIEKNQELTPDKFFSDLNLEENNKKDNSEESINSIEDIENLIDSQDNDVTPDSFFKNVIDKLFSGDDISLKTEYENEDSVFCGMKLEFLAKECGFQMGKNILPIREKKMVSHKRQSRQEIIMSMWQKEQQIRAQEEQELFKKRINMD